MTLNVSRVSEGPDASPRDLAGESMMWLVTRYGQGLFSYLLALLDDRDHAQDCLQEAYARAYENLSKNRPVNSTWLYKVARNLATDVVRYRRRFPGGSQLLEEVHEPDGYEAVVDVRRVMALLSLTDRELLYLCDVDDMSASEIAAVLGIREGAVRTRVFRARERFRQAFEQERDAE